MNSIFDVLVDLPLFRGVTVERMSEVVTKTRFNFQKYAAGETIVSQGEQCDSLLFILAGRVRLIVSDDATGLRVEQTLCAPDVVCPDCLFGLSTTYMATAVAIDNISTVSVSKTDYLDILACDRIFMINYINLLSKNAQLNVRGVLSIANGELSRRIALWILALTQARAEDITIICDAKALAKMMGITPRAIEATLQQMVTNGIISYHANQIHINDRRLVTKMLSV